MPGFDPRKPLSTEIKLHLSIHLDTAIRHLKEQPDGVDEAIHKARKSLKRSRALLKLCRDASPKTLPHAARRLGAAARSIAGMRDAAALVECVNWLEPWFFEKGAQDLVSCMQQQLRARHGKHTADEAEIVRQIEGAITLCRTTKTSLKKARYKSDENASRILAGGWARRHKRAVKALARCRAQGQEADFHELRKSAQQTVYQAALLERAWPTGLNAIADDAKKLAEVLGHEHDLTMLLALEKSEPDALCPSQERPRMLTLIKERQSALRSEAIEIGQALYGGYWKNECKRVKRLWELMQ